ncbi:MAG: ATP-binding protein, partial [Rugosibacter sp.]
MVHTRKGEDAFGSLFEEDYLLRTLGRIAHDPDVALTELVANAWDAGASFVDITIPPEKQNTLVVSDDGHGMSAAQFKSRWMTLAYDRVKHQSQNVEFPPERTHWRRRAYGRNGVGRHGMLCFADRYEVETWREGKGAQFV